VANIFLFIAAIVDLALAVILIGISGFLFGPGPESMHGGALATAVYAAAVIGCLAVPVVGLVLHKRGKTAAGMLIAWLPPAGALLALAIPAPY
jgi:uncharacterized sodium:solute symporter family permease YidK